MNKGYFDKLLNAIGISFVAPRPNHPGHEIVSKIRQSALNGEMDVCLPADEMAMLSDYLDEQQRFRLECNGGIKLDGVFVHG
jgi:hypothetical protein